MRHQRNLVILVCLVAAIALLTRQPVQPSSEWVDLVKLGELKRSTGGRGYRCTIEREGQPTLKLTLTKPRGGNHNRVWCLTIAEVHHGGTVQNQMFRWDLTEPMPEEDEPELASITTLQANDGILPDHFSSPGFWYRVAPSGLEVLVHQQSNPWNSGFNYEEGYYIWTAGGGWSASDPHGTIKGPTHYVHARLRADPPKAAIPTSK